MSKGLIALLVCGLFFVLESGPLAAQETGRATLEGRVVNAESGEPLAGAHVFLSGTTMGTVTNAAGRYRLRGVPPGAYRLTISMIGFGRSATEAIVRAEETKIVNRQLNPVIYEFDELVVELDEDWEKDLQRFTRLFIGESARADSVVIVNPEVLRFRSRWWGRFTARAHAPLVIENYSLGYRITFFLDEFRHSGTVTRWDGDPLFQEMSPADSAQAARWEENRKEAFFGSYRHFLLSLIDDQVREEGFIVYRHPRTRAGIPPSTRFQTSASRLVNASDNDPFYKFNFFGRLEIIYTRAGEEENFVRWERNRYRAPAGRQVSYLELNRRPVTIDLDGGIVETYGTTRYGYFSFRRVADQTPREYRPDRLQRR